MSPGHLFYPLLPISYRFSLPRVEARGLWFVRIDSLQPSGSHAGPLFLLEAVVSLLGYFLAASN